LKPQIWFIHGAASTPLSFNWLKEKLNPHVAVDVAYDNLVPLKDTINYIKTQIAKCDEPPLVIGHSLGGIIGAAIAQDVPVAKLVTMGTPFGGSFAATVVKWFMPTQLMRDIAHQSPVLTSLQHSPPKIPMMSIVSDSGLMMLGERTDGVVTVKSQMVLDGPKYMRVDFNHFEVLLAPPVAEMINEFFFEQTNDQ
jgi:pimeloyl-ACP methyl ester carboxylesterase